MMESHSPHHLFEPGGTFRQVNRESVLLLGGGAALLMQVAHPKIAAAVDEHSSFRREPLRRLEATVRAMQRIIFGSREQALATAAHIREIHNRVNGVLPEGTAWFQQGEAYSANDPELTLWVYAALTWTTLKTYGETVGPLTRAAAADYYTESRTLARLFGTPDESIPADLDAFERYCHDMVEGPILEITPTARRVAACIIDPPVGIIPGSVKRLMSIPAIALLPDTLRDRYGFVLDPRREQIWQSGRTVIRRSLPLIPRFLRTNRAARRTDLNTQHFRGKSPDRNA